MTPFLLHAALPMPPPQTAAPHHTSIISTFFDLVVFDLDDTLATLEPVVAASDAVDDFMRQKMPKTYLAAKNRLGKLMKK